MGVVVRRYNIVTVILTIIINFPYSTCISGSNIRTSLFILKCFFALRIRRQNGDFFTSRGAHAPKLHYYGDVIHSF